MDAVYINVTTMWQDYQVVNLELEDGSTVTMTMSAFTDRGGRESRIMGTKGEIIANMEENLIRVALFGQPQEIIDVSTLAPEQSRKQKGIPVRINEI